MIPITQSLTSLFGTRCYAVLRAGAGIIHHSDKDVPRSTSCLSSSNINFSLPTLRETNKSFSHIPSASAPNSQENMAARLCLSSTRFSLPSESRKVVWCVRNLRAAPSDPSPSFIPILLGSAYSSRTPSAATGGMGPGRSMQGKAKGEA